LLPGFGILALLTIHNSYASELQESF